MGDVYAKEIRQILESFETEDRLENVDENKVWMLYDFQTSKVCSLPHGTAASVLTKLFDAQASGGCTDDGEPKYFIGEKIGSTRSLRIDFSGDVKKSYEETTLFKMIIAAVSMAFDEMFERSPSRLETRVCSILISSEQTACLDFTVLFPFCRMKNDDFNAFMTHLERVVDQSFSKNIYDAFNGVESFGDILQNSTFDDVYPLFGCAKAEEDYVKDKYQVWLVDEIPRSIDEIPSCNIELVDDEDEIGQLLPINKHFLVSNKFIVPSISQEHKMRPLTFTNAYCKTRVTMKSGIKVGDSDPTGISYSFGAKTSPFTRKVRESIKKKIGDRSEDEEVTDLVSKVYSFYKDLALEKRPSVQVTKSDESRIIKYMQSKKHLEEVQRLIDLFADANDWFKITSLQEKPPIKVGANGFYLDFKSLPMILDKLDGRKRCLITSELEDLACIIYTVASNHEQHEEARHMFIEFVRDKNPQAFQERGGADGLSKMYSRQIKRASKGRLTFWTLLEMFKEDMPLYYNLWWQYIYDYYLLHTIENEMASFSIAKAASFPLIGKFVHTSGDAKPTWWRYSGTFWENIHDSQRIELFVTTKFVLDLMSAEKRYDTENFGASSGKNTYNNVRGNLQKTGMRSSVMRDIAILLHDNRVVDFSDGSDPEYADFFASYNFVYQFSDGEMKRRPGRWEDFLTKCFDVIDECLPITDPKCQFIIDWVHKMIRDRETEHEFLKEISTCIRGFNRHKRFSVWYGFGNGGKSKFMDLFSSTLGLKNGHAVKIPLESMLEGGKKSAGAASPEIDQARNAFLAIYDEPKKGQKFDAGKIKATTGNDPQYSRTLFSKGGSFRPMFKSVLLGNIVPKADFDDAMKNRFWVWNFKGKFADPAECPSTAEEQERLGIYPLDYDMDTKLPEFRAAMLAVLLHYFKIYNKEGIRKTKDIIRATEQFWNSANDVLCFLHENVVKTDDKEASINNDELYDTFRRWFMNRNNGERVITKIGFLDEIMAIKTDQNVKENGGLMGYRFRDI